MPAAVIQIDWVKSFDSVHFLNKTVNLLNLTAIRCFTCVRIVHVSNTVTVPQLLG